MSGELAHPAKGPLPVACIGDLAVPSPVMAEGERAAVRYVEFFTAQIRNPNARAAYALFECASDAACPCLPSSRRTSPPG